MIEKGAKGTEGEIRMVVDYMVKYFGKASPKPNFFWPIRINPLNKWGLSDFCDVVYWVQLQVLLHSGLHWD